MATATMVSYRQSVVEHVIDSDITHWQIQTNNIRFVTSCIDVLQSTDAEIEIRWLCTSETLKTLEENFVVAAKLSELIADGQFSVRTRTQTESDTSTLLLNPERTVQLLGITGDDTVEIVLTDDEITDRLWQTHQQRWEIGLPETVDVPPYTQLLTIVEEKLGPAVSEDIATAYTALETRSSNTSLEPVTVGLLVSAKHDVLLRDVVEWAETSTLATQGTVSKLKQRLEDGGVVTTESENIGVGRPRQRLDLADESLQALPADELVANVQCVLS